MSKQEDMNNLIDNMFMTSKQKEDIREARLYLKTLPIETRREVYAKGMAEVFKPHWHAQLTLRHSWSTRQYRSGLRPGPAADTTAAAPPFRR